MLVVLSGGRSRRLGRPKALVELGGATPLERLLGCGAAAGLAERLVVAGAHANELRAALDGASGGGRGGAPNRGAAGPAPELVDNPDWAAGRTGSVAAAARARPGRALMIAPVDVPLVSTAVLAALAQAWCSAPAPDAWIGPFLEGTEPRRFGHPLVLGPALAARTTEVPPDRPLRALRAESEHLVAVAVADPAILDDLDAPDDLAALRRRLTDSGPTA